MEFYEIESEFYDIFYFDFHDDADFYRRYVDDCPEILEFMCGTGRILYYLKHENMWGVDSSAKMLSRARENLKDANVHLILGDVRAVDLNKKFCVVIIGLNSLIMFPMEERVVILKNAVRHLKPNGRVLIDIFNPLEFVENIVHHGDTKIVNDVVYSRFFIPQREGEHWKILYLYDIVRNGNLTRKIAEMHLYPVNLEELKKEMQEAGLTILEVYGDYDFSPYDENKSERILVVGALNED